MVSADAICTFKSYAKSNSLKKPTKWLYQLFCYFLAGYKFCDSKFFVTFSCTNVIIWDLNYAPYFVLPLQVVWHPNTRCASRWLVSPKNNGFLKYICSIKKTQERTMWLSAISVRIQRFHFHQYAFQTTHRLSMSSTKQNRRKAVNMWCVYAGELFILSCSKFLLTR